MAKKTTATPAGDKVDRTLPFTLSDQEKARKGEGAAKLNKLLEAAVAFKKTEMSKHNVKIKELTSKISNDLKVINEGIERRPVKATAVKNYEKDVIEFWFDGEVKETVPMKPEDRQMDLKEGKKKASGKREKWQTMMPKFKPKTDVEDERDADIASVHRIETSRKGASSSVDRK